MEDGGNPLERAAATQRLMLGTAVDVGRVVARAAGSQGQSVPELESGEVQGDPDDVDVEEETGATASRDGIPPPLLDGGDGESSQ